MHPELPGVDGGGETVGYQWNEEHLGVSCYKLEVIGCPCPQVPLWAVPNDNAGSLSARSLCQVEGWGFPSSIPLLGADSHMDEAKKSMSVRTHPPQQSRDFCRFTVVRVRQSVIPLQTQKTGQLWRSGAHMFIRVFTHIHVHITRTRTHKITDRSYPHPSTPAPQHSQLWGCEMAAGGSNGLCLDH